MNLDKRDARPFAADEPRNLELPRVIDVFAVSPNSGDQGSHTQHLHRTLSAFL
jgi:hypothetical protein